MTPGNAQFEQALRESVATHLAREKWIPHITKETLLTRAQRRAGQRRMAKVLLRQKQGKTR